MFSDTGSSGFEGAVGGMPLSDVIQLKAYNRFSGVITVEYNQQAGTIYFRNGEIVHAEQGAFYGEEAFYQLIRWPGGRFAMQNNVMAPHRTIENSVSYLLLEAHRLMDEEAEGISPPPTPGQSTAPQAKGGGILDRLAQLTGVAAVALFDAQGTVLDRRGGDADAVAARGFALANAARTLGGLFGVGGLGSVAFQDQDLQIIMFESRQQYLVVSAEQGHALAQLEADIRTAMTGRK